MFRRGLFTLVIAVINALSGCATSLPPIHTGDRNNDTGTRIARAALDVLGTPYRYGGNSTDGFDCSGLVQYAHAMNGINVPRTTATQFAAAKNSPAGLRTGDVLFFRIDGRVSHSGIYLGNGKFIHAPSSGKNVSITRTDNPYFRKRLAGIRRFH